MPFTFDKFMTDSLYIIATASGDNPLFLIHLINNLSKIADVSHNNGRKTILKNLLKTVKRFTKKFEFDQENDKRYENALKRFESNLNSKKTDT